MRWQDTTSDDLESRLIRRLMDLTDLDEHQAQLVVAEIFDACSPSVDEFIQTRHAQLQRQGYRGQEIYAVIQAELSHWRFGAPALSIRQIRRRIYG